MINNQKIIKFFSFLGENIILKYKAIIILALLLIIGLTGIGIKNLKVDSSNDSFLNKKDEITILNDKYKEIFGSEEFIFVNVESDNIFSYDTLSLVRQLSEEIKERVPFVDEVTSLTNVEYTEWLDETLVIEDFIAENIPEDDESLEELKTKALSKELYSPFFSKDFKNIGIYVSFQEIPEEVLLPVKKGFNFTDQLKWSDDKIIFSDKVFAKDDFSEDKIPADLTTVKDPRKLIYPAIKTIVKKYRKINKSITPIGMPIFDFELDKIMDEEISKLGLFSIIIAGIFLLLFFRSFRSMIIPLIIAVGTLVMLLGMMGYFGFPINITTMIIPNLILVISVSYSVHFINHFKDHFNKTGKRRDAVNYTIEIASLPCFLSGLTTSIGFLSFIFVPFKPLRQIGIICSSGVMITFLLIYIIVPILLSFGKDKKVLPSTERINKSEKLIANFSNLIFKHPLPIAVISLILIIFLTISMKNITVSSDFVEVLGDKIDVTKEIKDVTGKLGTMYSYEVLIELPEKDMVKDPEVVNAIEHISKYLQKNQNVKTTFSIVKIIKDMSQSLNENNPEFYRIPNNKNEISQYLLLYEMSGGENLDELVDFDFKTTHITIQLKDMLKRHEMKSIKEALAQFNEQLFPVGTNMKIVGDVPVLIRIVENIIFGQIFSVLIAFVLISIVMIIVLKSFRVGLIMMIPNVMPVFFLLGLMGIFKINIDIVTMLISPIIIGIAVDDTIHFGVHYQLEYLKYNSYRKANEMTFIKLVKPFIFTGVILIAGFGMIAFSKVNSLKNYAIFSGIAILIALLADLFLTTALFKLIKPFGKEKNND